jgi:hypothetical protein
MQGKKYNYAICVPFTDDWKDVFHIPPLTTIDGLMLKGEKPHPRAKCVNKPTSPFGRIEMYEDRDYDEPKIREHLVTPLKTEVYREKINKYQKARVEF